MYFVYIHDHVAATVAPGHVLWRGRARSAVQPGRGRGRGRRRGLERLPVTHQFDAEIQTHAVHRTDDRVTCHEGGAALDEKVAVRVWDSTAEIRYLVLPERPAGTEGLTEEQLADLITRDAMVGTAKVDAGKAGAP